MTRAPRRIRKEVMKGGKLKRSEVVHFLVLNELACGKKRKSRLVTMDKQLVSCQACKKVS